MTNKNFTSPFRFKISQTGSVSPADRQNVLKIFLRYFKNGEISSPVSLLAAFILIGVLMGALATWLLYSLPPMSRLMTLILDPVLVLLLVTPFYAFLLRPMVLNHDKGKRSQEALQAANTLLERLFSINHILIAYLDPQFRFIRVNLAFARVSGLDPEFFPGKHLFEIYPAAENEPAFKQVLESGKPSFLYDRKYQSLAHPELGATYWDWSVYPVTEAVEGVSGIILSCIDVTERAMVREALHKAYDELEIRVKERTAELAIERSKLNAIIVNAPEGIVVADTQARIILSNPAAERIYGRPVPYGESYENQAALCLCHPDGSPYDPRQLPLTISALDGEALDEIEMCVVWPDGQRRELLVCTAPIRESQGKIKGAVGIYQDITERKQTEAALQKAYEELELRIQERTREISLANEELILEIAERMRIEQVLASERERLFSLMNEIPLFVTLIGPQYNILFANNTHKNLFGDIDERPCYLSRDNQIVPCEGCQLKKVLETRVPVEWEWTSQEGKSYQIFEYPFTDVDGSELILELGIDRTQRKQMIEQLEQTNQALLSLSQVERNHRLLAEGLIEATLALNSSLNLDDVLDRILDQIQRVIPFDAANISLLEDNHLTVVRQRGYERYPEALANIDIPFTLDDYPVLHNIEGQPTFILIPDTRREPRWRKSTGLEWVLSCMSAPLMAGSTFLGFLRLYSEQTNNFRQEHIDILNAFTIHATIAIQNARLYEDLTIALEKEQSMRAQLVQNEKLAAIGRTIASVSHELNNPLQTIKNCLYLIQQEVDPDGYIQEPLQIVKTETQRISDLVSELRELYRPNKAAPAHLKKLKDIIDDVHSLLIPQLSACGVEWRQDASFDRSDPTVLAIPDQLKQVFINICVNAIEAMGAAGGFLELRLEANVVSNQIGVCFIDSGSGITSEDVPKLFEPFFTTKPNGTGLGLPICLEIVQRHGGQITVDSAVGKGTTFIVWLPQVGPTKRIMKTKVLS